MKYLLLFFIPIFGCGNSPIKTGVFCKITRYEKTTDPYCVYYGEGTHDYCAICWDEFRFVDTCGKFKVGDDINITLAK